MNYITFLEAALEDPEVLRPRWIYWSEESPFMGIGLRFEMRGNTLVYKVLHIQATDGQIIAEANTFDVMTSTEIIPLEVRELACQVERKAQMYLRDSTLEHDFLTIDQTKIKTVRRVFT